MERVTACRLPHQLSSQPFPSSYKKVIETNKLTVVTNEAYMQKSGQDNELYKMYRMHKLATTF